MDAGTENHTRHKSSVKIHMPAHTEKAEGPKTTEDEETDKDNRAEEAAHFSKKKKKKESKK
jgi:hypothetical protein